MTRNNSNRNRKPNVVYMKDFPDKCNKRDWPAPTVNEEMNFPPEDMRDTDEDRICGFSFIAAEIVQGTD
ncbi:MAG: hypothetical protein K2Z81_15235 [Cyanobacteria bacterium]|nr:hypothetical protein [Cyanobacteriota bacterium]